MENAENRLQRIRMVETQIEARGVRDARVLEAMRSIPRDLFVPSESAFRAFEDRALPIGMGQTISQPYIVALMTQLLAIEPQHRVLEIGTGSGYQTAILAMLARHVFSIERLEPLSSTAREQLNRLGLSNVTLLVADGSLGWPAESPFDRIIVTAAAPAITPALVDQLADGGRLVTPVGDDNSQYLTTVARQGDRTIETPSIAVRFVKLIGEQGFPS